MRLGANIVIGIISAERNRRMFRRRIRKGEVIALVASSPSSYDSRAGAVGCRDSGHMKIT